MTITNAMPNPQTYAYWVASLDLYSAARYRCLFEVQAWNS